jgi:ABC-type transporter Mla subunit MlaD
MRSIITLGAAALALAVALPAAAQSTSPADSSMGSTAASPASPDSSMGASTATAAKVAVGQPVKDSAGVTIGQVSQVKPDASGKEVATIKMGAESFAVDTSALAVDNGTALINATQAEIKSMMAKK